MAIGTVDQLKIYKGEIRPLNNLLKDLTAHMMLVEAYNINENGFDDTTNNALATSYVNKMNSAVNQIISFQSDTLERLLRLTVIALGDAFTLANLEGLNGDDTQWSVKIATVKTSVIELLAKVTEEEKTAYNLL